DERQGDRAEDDGEGDPDAHHQAREDVAADLVGAQQELFGGRLSDRVPEDLLGIMRHEQRREDADQADEDDEDEAGDGELVADEAPPPDAVDAGRDMRRRLVGSGSRWGHVGYLSFTRLSSTA